MLDLETMATTPTAAIVQIGAVLFNADRVDDWQVPLDHHLRDFECTIALQSSLLAGLDLDSGTLAWWRQQSTEAKASISGEAVSLNIALENFTQWFWSLQPHLEKRPQSVIKLWAYGAAFDVAVLENAYNKCGLEAPWYYRNVRDTRGLFEMAQNLTGWQRPKRVVSHTALADARAQAEDVVSAYRAIKDQCVIRKELRADSLAEHASGGSVYVVPPPDAKSFASPPYAAPETIEAMAKAAYERHSERVLRPGVSGVAWEDLPSRDDWIDEQLAAYDAYRKATMT